MPKMLDNFVRKAVRADFKKSDQFMVPGWPSAYTVKEYWKSGQNGKVCDIGIVFIGLLLHGAATVVLPLSLLTIIGRFNLSNELPAMFLLGGICAFAWLGALYYVGIYSGFLRYIIREDHDIKWY